MNADNPMPNTTHENPNLPSAPPAGSVLKMWNVWWGCEHHCNLGEVYAHGKEGALMVARLMYDRVLDVAECPTIGSAESSPNARTEPPPTGDSGTPKTL